MASRNKVSTDASSPVVNGEHFCTRQVLRQKAENTLRNRGAQSHEKLDLEAGQQILHELRVHQIELEMQNDELRRMQSAQHALQARYFALFDLAPVGYCIVSEQGLIQQANLTSATLLGVDRRDLAQQPISRFICDEDQDIFYLCRKKILATGEPQSCELRMTKNHSSQFWAYLAATVANEADGARAAHCVDGRYRAQACRGRVAHCRYSLCVPERDGDYRF